MYKRYAWIALGTMAILATVLFFHASEEEQILERLEALRVLAEVRSPGVSLEQIARAKQIGAFFREQSHFELSTVGYGNIMISDRQELVRRIARGRARLAALELAIQDPQVRIEGNRARLRLQGSALGSIQGEQGQFLEIHSVEVLLEKEAGEWLVAGAVHLRDERQPHPQPGL
jgi:hypothetical protein